MKRRLLVLTVALLCLSVHHIFAQDETPAQLFNTRQHANNNY